MKTTSEMRKPSLQGFKLLVAFALLFNAAQSSKGQSVLIARFNGGGGGSTSSASFLDVTSVSFELGYVGSVTGGICEFQRVGCEEIPLAQIVPGALFDFDAFNSTHFTSVVTGLTNGSNQLLWSVTRLFNSSDALLFGSGGGNFESFSLNGSPDLAGAQIDFIRLKVNSFTLSERTCCGGGGLDYQADINWELYGQGRPLVSIDIKPQSCPNPLNTRSRGVLPVAILGTADLKVEDINRDSIRLQRDNGIGGEVSPLFDRVQTEDVSRPAVDPQNECDCTTDAVDGINDLNLKFDTQEVVTILELGNFENNEHVRLVLTGELDDGTPIVGKDCLVIKFREGEAEKAKLEVDKILPPSDTILRSYPNPFNPSTTITFAVPKAEEVNLVIYSMRGQLIQTLHSGTAAAGQHSFVWDGTDSHGSKVTNGIYVCRLQGKDFVVTRRLIFTK